MKSVRLPGSETAPLRAGPEIRAELDSLFPAPRAPSPLEML